MKTLLLSDIFPPQFGGTATWFWELYRRLPHEALHFAVGTTPGADDFDALHSLNLTRVPLTLTDWGLLSRQGRQGYRHALQHLRPLITAHDVVQVHAARCLPEGVMAMLLKWQLGLPYLCYVHGEDIGTAQTSRELKFLIRRVFGSASILIANSQNTAVLLREQWGQPPQKVHVLPPGTNAAYYKPVSEDEQQAIRERLGWGTRPVVLTVGRLQRRKGHDQLIRSLPSLLETFPDLLYVIAGEGDERESLGELASSLGVAGAVQFAGGVAIEELLALYQTCDVFALPNRDINGDIEGFGIVLLEAQSCGKPVIAGQSGGTGEAMRPGETGLRVDCRTPEPLQQALVDLLSDEPRRKELGATGRDWVVNHFDWPALVDRALSLFAQLPSRARRPVARLATAAGAEAPAE